VCWHLSAGPSDSGGAQGLEALQQIGSRMSATDVTKTTSSFMSEVMQKRATECSCKNRNVATRGSTLRHYPVVTKASQPPALSPDFGPRPSSGSLTPLGSPTTEHGMDSAMMKQKCLLGSALESSDQFARLRRSLELTLFRHSSPGPSMAAM